MDKTQRRMRVMHDGFVALATVLSLTAATLAADIVWRKLANASGDEAFAICTAAIIACAVAFAIATMAFVADNVMFANARRDR